MRVGGTSWPSEGSGRTRSFFATRRQPIASELRVVLGKLTRRLREHANKWDLSLSQVAVLGYLDREGPSTVTTLARAEGVRPQSMGATVGAEYATESIMSIYALEGMYCLYAFKGIYYPNEIPVTDLGTTRKALAIPAKRPSSHPSTAWNARRLGPNSNRKNRSRSAACQRWTVIQNFKCPRGTSTTVQ